MARSVVIYSRLDGSESPEDPASVRETKSATRWVGPAYWKHEETVK